MIQLLFRVSHNTYTDKNPGVCVKTSLLLKWTPCAFLCRVDV